MYDTLGVLQRVLLLLTGRGIALSEMVTMLDQQLHRLDAVELGAFALVIAVVIAALLTATLVAVVSSLKRLTELRNLERDGFIRYYEALQGILRQASTCAAQVEQLKQEMATHAANREAQLEERKRILKSIAGHLKGP
jgi:hypothetical protein